MLQILMTLALGGLSQWALSAVVDPADQKEGNKRVIVLSGDEGEHLNITTAGGCGVGTLVFVGEEGDRDDGRSENRKVRTIVKRFGHAQAVDENRGWLGVSIGEVPDAVGSQINLDGRGILVLNVITDSPADRGGVESHDVIVAIDGTELDGTVGQAVGLIGSHKPGEEVTIKALREGKEQTITVELAARQDMPRFEWKMAVPPLAELEEEIRTSGCIVRRGSDGNWVFENLGDLTDLADLPEDILQFIPKPGSHSIHVWGDDSNKKVRCRIQQDGTSIEINQDNDGEIVVTRKDEDGNESTATYANADELRDGDAEAHEFFNNADDAIIVKLKVDGLSDLHDLHDLSDIDVDVELGDLGDWTAHLGEGVAQFGEHMEELHAVLENLKSGSGSHKSPTAFAFSQFMGKPRHTFEVRTDGTIEARIRRGDSELVRLYENEADFEQRNPDLFKKYEGLTAVEE